MQRREFITLLGGAATTWPLAARAQQPAKMKRIALVSPAAKVSEMSVSGRAFHPAFFEELSRLGYVEDQNLGVERYSGEGRPEHYAELARDVVNTHPDLIFAAGVRLSLNFKMATTTIPIVTNSHRSDCRRTCGKHRAAGRQHHRRYHGCGIGTHWKTYGAAGRGDAQTVHRRLPCIAIILGRSKKCGNERGGQKGGACVVACYAGQF
jgi:hypothetical protein